MLGLQYPGQVIPVRPSHASLRPCRLARALGKPSQQHNVLHSKPCRLAPLQAAKVEAKEEKEERIAPVEFDDLSSEDGPGLTTDQVQSMMEIICNETDIAEVQLEMGSFHMKLRRHVEARTQAAPSPMMTPPTVGGSTSSFDLPQSEVQKYEQQHSQGSNGASAEEEEPGRDESLVHVSSPKVGIMRRGRYRKGNKIGKAPSATEGDKVKSGQVLGYVEQLGTFVPIEAPQAGEIVEFLVDEGDPVAYKMDVVSLAPFFGGHIIGDSKYA
eukprot:jgi/Astpho2/8048/Aster-02998